jgi:dienelactone hydrolase
MILPRLLLTTFGLSFMLNAETLPPLAEGKVPMSVEELYAPFDPAKEPLEVTVVKEHEEDGIVVRRLTYVVGTFKGRKSVMGAFHAYPKQREGKLPGIVQMHGGGQVAQAGTVIGWAMNGYSAIAINWGGEAMAGQLAGEPGTDWGALDATQKGHNSHYASCQPDGMTLDPFESPRNNNWFLIALAAQRAVTFLQQQPEVDPARIGATGHSMGGTLTVMLAGSDPRIKAAAPSCGGVGEAPESLRARSGNAARPKNPSRIHAATIDETNYLRRITCPIVYLGPQNDFNGLLDELFLNWEAVPSEQVAFAISKHLNHRQDQGASFVDALWFEQHLKGRITLPRTPEIAAVLKGPQGEPMVTVRPDPAHPVEKVEILYACDPNGQFRFWRGAEVRREGDAWLARCPVFSADLPLYFIANVHYRFPDQKLAGPPWNPRPGNYYFLSSKLLAFEAPAVRAAGLVASESHDRLVEADFATLGDWYELERGHPEVHQIVTRKVKDPKWRGPDGATLAIDVRDPRGGALALSFEFNSYRQYGADRVSGEFAAELPFPASPEWRTLELKLADLIPMDGKSALPENWQTLCALGISGRLKTGGGTTLGAGRFDAERQLRNLRWVGGTVPDTLRMPGGSVLDPAARAREFQQQIDRSIELEKREQQK